MSRSMSLLALFLIPIVLPHNTLAQPIRAADSAYQAGDASGRLGDRLSDSLPGRCLRAGEP